MNETDEENPITTIDNFDTLKIFMIPDNTGYRIKYNFKKLRFRLNNVYTEKGIEKQAKHSFMNISIVPDEKNNMPTNNTTLNYYPFMNNLCELFRSPIKNKLRFKGFSKSFKDVIYVSPLKNTYFKAYLAKNFRISYRENTTRVISLQNKNFDVVFDVYNIWFYENTYGLTLNITEIII